MGVIEGRGGSTRGSRDRIIVGLKSDIAILIDVSCVVSIRRGQMGRQRYEEPALMLEGHRGNQSGLALRFVVHAHGGPLESLPVQILQILEIASGKKVCFHGEKTAFFSGFSIGMPALMAEELESALAAKGRHFRDDDRVFADASQAG